ncbi:hypothetical protein Tph_c14910 [Thermacetogenium phaeum DSM 12270]|uniref:Uncharacterized protein n=1 Tax=Thermacetogenium phaeum (strain ATCC BAA-254 / DSM 26808 / PB) TaxID=1089553 RepID=K4LUJ5_THEPS|nr:hypothetical protein Tph_c14910 [Thermacetogenium phaeum DSM 12270]
MLLLLLGLFILTLIFFFVLNFHQIRRGRFVFQWRSFILPFSLSLALLIVDLFLKVALHYALIIFVFVAASCYLLLHLLAKRSKPER